MYLRVTKLMGQSYLACASEPGSHKARSLHTLELVLHSKRTHCDEKPVHHSTEQSPLTETTEKPAQQ